MAYSVNWATQVITIPKTDTTFVSSSPDVRSLDISTLWRALIDIQDNEDGIAYLDILQNTPPHVLAGVTYSREIQIINGYTITFEDGQYAVNIIGGNSNIADIINKNQVSVNTANSGGLVTVSTGSGLSSEQAQQLLELYMLQGLDQTNPMSVSPTTRTTGSVTQDIQQVGNTVTVTRQ